MAFLEAQRALLDQLMGRDRDLEESEKREQHFSDEDVDRYYLVCGWTPYVLFQNTKSEINESWDKISDPKLKAQWDALSDREKAGYGCVLAG